MCRILTLSNISKVTDFQKLVDTSARIMREAKQQDGFGFVVRNADNTLAGERTNAVTDYKYGRKLLNFGFLAGADTFNSFGTVNSPQAFIAHGRTSTNNKDLVNVHPINKNGWSLVHNGVVTNLAAPYEQHTTNDSEHVVHHLSTGGIDAVADNLKGYYAFSAFDSNGTMHVGRDKIATLYASHIEDIEALCFATKPEMIKELCSSMWFKTFTEPQAVKDDHYITITAAGEINFSTFESLGKDTYSASLSQLSLGRSLESYSTPYSSQYWQQKTKADKIKDFADTLAADERISFYQFLNIIQREQGLYGFDRWNRRIEGAMLKDLEINELMQVDVFDSKGRFVDPQSPSKKSRQHTLQDFGYGLETKSAAV